MQPAEEAARMLNTIVELPLRSIWREAQFDALIIFHLMGLWDSWRDSVLVAGAGD